MSAARNQDSEPVSVLVSAVRGFALAVSRLSCQIEFHDTHNISELGDGGFIVASNHPTYLDPFWISLPIKRDLRFLAWDRAFEIPFVGELIRRLGAVPMSLEKGGTTGTLKRSLKILDQGCGLVVFPEGEREFENGELLPFKTGVAQLAMRAGVPILPVTVVGGNRVWPRDWVLPRVGKIDVLYHPVFRVENCKNADERQAILMEQTERLRRIIAGGLKSSN